MRYFFDNLSVTHYSGPLLQETHYYPFGLTMSGIRDKALKSLYAKNKFRYNKGAELQNREFSDGSSIEAYDAIHRLYDPQIGRFFRIDDFSEIKYESSPYSFALNNPILFYDPFGDSATLPTFTVTAAGRGTLTYRLNHYNFEQVDAWVESMMAKGHAPRQIYFWAISNDLLNST